MTGKLFDLELAIPFSRDGSLKGKVERCLSSCQYELNGDRVVISAIEQPSEIYSQLRARCKDQPVIIRGVSSATNTKMEWKESGVCILDCPYPTRGLVRFIPIDEQTTALDISIDQNLQSETGKQVDLCLFESSPPPDVVFGRDRSIKSLGSLIDKIPLQNSSSQQLNIRSVDFRKILGGSACLSQGDEVIVCGIIARSAGVKQNTKTVCACSGKTLWEESRI
jgi:copper chaperone for superoxide dismutase